MLVSPRKARLFTVVLIAALGFAASYAPGADARQSGAVSYRYEQVWGAAIRMVRVDYGYQLVDRDRDIGFLMFQYAENGTQHSGSVELVRTVQHGNEVVRVVVNIPTMPNYIERMMLQRLERKLRSDFGLPIRRPVATPEPEPADDEAAEDAERREGDGADGE